MISFDKVQDLGIGSELELIEFIQIYVAMVLINLSAGGEMKCKSQYRQNLILEPTTMKVNTK